MLQLSFSSFHQTVDWSDSLTFRLFPARGRNLEVWPKKPAEFKGSVEAYSAEVGKVSERLLCCLSMNMGMERDVLLQLHKEMQISMRVNYYPVCSNPDKVMGLSPHSDGTTITVLVQDADINGLQIRHDGGWVPVKPVPNSLVVNIGDIMEIWSNGKYKSIEHRAVTNAARARISFASFVCPQMDVDVEPLEKMLDVQEQQKMYKKVKFEDYLKNILKGKIQGKERIADYAT